MGSKAAKRRAKKKLADQPAAKSADLQLVRTVAHETSRPTPERHSKGVWAQPQGGAKDQQPMVDLASDMIGALYQAKKLTASQEQAARLFQELRAGYLAEIGTRGYGSCLADNQTGYDGGDGNEAVIKAYRSLEGSIGHIKTACLILETEKGPDQQPYDLSVLRRSLDCMAGG